MANEVKKYFLAPSYDYTQKAKAGVTIALWNVVKSPTEMVPPLLATKSQPEEDDILKSTKSKFEWLRERGGEKKFGVFSQFLQATGIGLHAGHQRKKSVRLLYKFETIETREAYPSDKHVKELIKEPSMVRYLEKNGFDKPIYIVVGTKTATGATVQELEMKERSTDAKVAIDLIPVGVPISMGPEVSFSSNANEIVGFKEASEFIFAFRLRRIKVNAQMDIDEEDETEGAVLGDYEESDDEGFEVLGIEDNDLGSIVVGDEIEVEDEGERVRVVVPSSLSDS